MSTVFSINDVSLQHPQGAAIRVGQWEAAQGEHWLLRGPSGSGKTTILHLLAGLLTPGRGTISIAGQDWSALRGARRDRFRGQHVGIVFQSLHLINTLTVTDNLRAARYLAGLSPAPQRIEALLERLGLADMGRRYPDDLSQGQAQRVALARALINEPRLLLADEPTSHLDDHNCRQVMTLVREHAAEVNATLVVASHDGRISDQFPRCYQTGGEQ